MKKNKLKIKMHKYRRWSSGLIMGWVFIIFGTALPGDVTEAQITKWVARYNGTGNSDDEANAIVVDADGNVYVTGSSSGDYATVKYDGENGAQLWVAHHNGPGGLSDEGNAIAVDVHGNVFVTGQSYGSGTYNDYATIKYDGVNGEQLWEERYNGPVNSSDVANAIALDAAGNVYVTGHSLGYGLYNDYATIKYDTNGNKKWEIRYNEESNYDDEANAIVVDADGNVYVTGSSSGDYATVKYETIVNGPAKEDVKEVWVARYNGPGNYFDVANAIAMDVTGNVYVTGKSKGRGYYYGYDYATVKYDSNGNKQWVARYNGQAFSDDEANAIVVDADGNVYVTGSSSGDYATVKYDGVTGTQIWVVRYDGLGNSTDLANAIALDANGDVYVTGASYGSGTGYNYATVKYDSVTGNQLWDVRFNEQVNSDDKATAIAVDAYGNVYVTGGSDGAVTLYDYATVKYRQSCKGRIEQLIDYVNELKLKQENSLVAKLNNALKSLEDDNSNNDIAAINSLKAFINAVETQPGNHIPLIDADALVKAALAIIDCLSHQQEDTY